MKFRRCSIDSYWYCEITLEEHEWPPGGNDEACFTSPIRAWVYGNCSDFFFSYRGAVLFAHREDAVQFQLVWG
jgi:hypothetical protein